LPTKFLTLPSLLRSLFSFFFIAYNHF